MSVIVTDGMSIEQALKLLWREANRENIPHELERRDHRIIESYVRHQVKKEWKKRKRRRRSAARKLRNKGQLRAL